jgi:hypothetical protein
MTGGFTRGLVDLVAHHTITSDGAWLVQIGGEFGALDLAAPRAACRVSNFSGPAP